jgi:hypothetical protein
MEVRRTLARQKIDDGIDAQKQNNFFDSRDIDESYPTLDYFSDRFSDFKCVAARKTSIGKNAIRLHIFLEQCVFTRQSA